MDELKLVALEEDDVKIVSAHVQDALVKVSDILWLPGDHRFVMALNRFDWMAAVNGDAFPADASIAVLNKAGDYRRCRTALRFERVISCKCRGLDQNNKNAMLNLLAVEFTAGEAPAGDVTLTFSGGGMIRLEVECLEAELVDLGEIFAAFSCPDHFAAPRTA